MTNNESKEKRIKKESSQRSLWGQNLFLRVSVKLSLRKVQNNKLKRLWSSKYPYLL